MIKEIAKLEGLICIEPSGEEKEFSISIGAPYKHPEGCWACLVSLPGLFDTVSKVYGDDSMQALCLAVQLPGELLGNLSKQGKKFLMQDDNGKRRLFPLEAYFNTKVG